MSGRPFAWEHSYSPGVAWDTPIVPSTLPQLLQDAVAAYGDRPALEYRDRRITFRDLGRRADAFAATLLAAGIGPGDALALYLPNTPDHPTAFFGGAKAGARLTNLSPLDAERELAYKLQDSGARTLVTADFASLLPMALRLLQAGHVDRIIVGEDAAWPSALVPLAPIPDDERVIPLSRFVADAAPPAAWPRLVPEDVALLQYTGGTTGTPKGAILTHGNLTASVQIYAAWFDPQLKAEPGTHRVICALPLFHIYALTTILLRHIRGGNEILLRLRFDPETVLRDVEVRRATSFPGVPTMWIALANHPGIETRDLSSLVHCSSGGAPLPVEVGAQFERLTGLKLRGGWGMTETAPAGTNLPLAGPVKPGSIGLPMPGVEVQVVALDDPSRVLPAGKVGELRVRGPNVTRGYWNRPEETQASFADGFLLTGDIGVMDEDGYFFIVDRRKDMIISGGFNVYPQAVEQAVYEHPSVEEVAVIGIADPYRGEAAKAFVRLKKGAPAFDLDELKAFLADKLGRHEMPAALEFRDRLPRTPVGKLSKVELRDEERRRAADAASAAFDKPRAGATS